MEGATCQSLKNNSLVKHEHSHSPGKTFTCFVASGMRKSILEDKPDQQLNLRNDKLSHGEVFLCTYYGQIHRGITGLPVYKFTHIVCTVFTEKTGIFSNVV